jgi:hypothetical protein
MHHIILFVFVVIVVIVAARGGIVVLVVLLLLRLDVRSTLRFDWWRCAAGRDLLGPHDLAGPRRRSGGLWGAAVECSAGLVSHVCGRLGTLLAGKREDRYASAVGGGFGRRFLGAKVVGLIANCA